MKEFDLEPGEFVVREARKHWLLFTIGLIPYALLALLPVVLRPLLSLSPQMAPYADSIDYAQPLVRAALGIWLLAVWTAAWSAFTRYFLNLWVLTNTRIVAITQHAFFHREVSSILLGRVQDVTSNVRGVLSSLIGIGSIKVQSAGAENDFLMPGISEPEEMRELILKHVPEEPQNTGI